MDKKWFGLTFRQLKNVRANLKSKLRDLVVLLDSYDCGYKLACHLHPEFINIDKYFKICKRIDKIIGK